MFRDFTYIDDIVSGILNLVTVTPKLNVNWDGNHPTADTSGVAPYQIYNIGNSEVIPLMDFIETLEDVIGIKAIKNMMPMQPGDVHLTSADTSKLETATGFKPYTPIREGLGAFVTWYRDFYDV